MRSAAGRRWSCSLCSAWRLVFPTLSDRMTRPLVALGSRLSERTASRGRRSIGSSLVLGVATGLLWAPCAGPILGIIFTAAAIKGATLQHDLAAARLCARRGDLAGAGAAGRRQGVRADEEVARRQRAHPPGARRAGAGRGRGDRARARHAGAGQIVERADREPRKQPRAQARRRRDRGRQPDARSAPTGS